MKPSTKYLKIAINILTMLLAVVFCIWVLPKLLVYFMPFVVAAVIALIANPLVKFLERKVKIVRKAGTAFVIIVVLGLVVLVSYLVIAKLISEMVGFVKTAPEIWETTSSTIKEISVMLNHYFDRMPIGLQDWLNGIGETFGADMTVWFQNTGTPLAESAGNFAKNLPLVIISIIMSILASYLFLAEKDYVVKVIQKIFPAKMQERWNLVYGTMKDAVGGYFKAQFKIMGVVYVILLIGLAILNIRYAFLIALLIAILDFLPFFGTGAVMWPWAVIAFFQNNYKLTIGLVVIWAVSQFVRQLIQPKLVGDSIGLEPIPTLVFLYIGFRVGGAFGLIIAVPVGMIIINLYRAGVFSNFVYSLQILTKDLSHLRRFEKEDLEKEGIMTIEEAERNMEAAREETKKKESK